MRIPDAAALVAAAKQALGAATDTDLGFELRTRYGIRSAQSTINRWGRGLGKPGYEATMALLDASGWLNEPAIQLGLEGGEVSAQTAALRRTGERARAQAEQQERARGRRKRVS